MARTLPAPSAQGTACAGAAGAVSAAMADADRRRVVVRERLSFARDLHDLLGPGCRRSRSRASWRCV
ncbi:hypothetical protein QMZ92_17555 [Streptomyces sp. HNM0645]|uniref:hypothetical protein n=1 Tax=Streptomyces sp. HNM0645 TaxID=2782343 RepID=UPI0024B839FB|nr:hypothetical protein [Streptomyces sp. HNM0645]MDI9886138.1 hypothetical protein [Streptomyces sp. HNM0645]